MNLIKTKNLIVDLLAYIKADYDTNPIDLQTWLYDLLGDQVDGTYNFYEQAKDVFLRGDSSPKNITVRLEMPKDITNLPCIVVREPARTKGLGNTIGRICGDIVEVDSADQRQVVLDHKRYSFEIMCVSANVLESVMISEVVYSLLMAYYSALSDDYTNVEIQLKEIMAETNLIPTPIIMRNIILDLDIYNGIPAIPLDSLISKIKFNPANIL